MRRRYCGEACGRKVVRFGLAHERPTSLSAAVAGGVECRGDQCALQLADRSGSARDRDRRTARASLSRRRFGRRGLCDGVPGGVRLCPANGGGAGVCAIGAQRAALSTPLRARRDGRARSRGGLASRPTTYLGQTSAQHRDVEGRGDEQSSNRAPVGRQREGHPQAGRSFEAHRECAACACWITTAAAGTPAAADVPSSATSRGEDAHHATPSAQERAGDSLTAPGDDGEPVPMSLDRDASDRTFDRQLAYLGLLDDAAPLFREGWAVPGAGVLLALPCLVESGLLRISRKLYGEIGPAFYGLRTTLLTLLLMALLRIKRPEHLKERDPAAFGRLLGLDRAPEVKTLRRRLTRLAANQRAEQLGAELARVRVDQRGHLMGFLYIDGHVRAYHGKRAISSRTYVPRRHLAMPASTDYWINDRSGDPLLVITGEMDAALTKAMPRLLREVRDVVRGRKVTIVFDRGGWSPKLFGRMIKDGFDVLTYRKGRCRRINDRRFIRRRGEFDRRWVDYLLHDQPVRFLKGKLRLRQVTRLCDDGHQTT